MGPAAWERRRTLLVVNLASIMECADEALLPAVYRDVGAALHATPTGLGALTLYRSIVQAACYPVAAYAASRHNRAHVIALGAFLWAAATFLVAVSDTFLQVSRPAAIGYIPLLLVLFVTRIHSECCAAAVRKIRLHQVSVFRFGSQSQSPTFSCC